MPSSGRFVTVYLAELHFGNGYMEIGLLISSLHVENSKLAVKAACKPRVFHQLLDCSAAQAVTFETTTRHDKGTSPTTGDARPVYTTVDSSQPTSGS